MDVRYDRLRDLIDTFDRRQDIADKIGVTVATVTKHHNYYDDPAKGTAVSIQTLVKYAKFFNVSTDYLLGLTDAKNQSRISAEDVAEDYTGLSKDVLQGLHSIKETSKKQKTILKDIKIVNALIKSIIKTDIEEI